MQDVSEAEQLAREFYDLRLFKRYAKNHEMLKYADEAMRLLSIRALELLSTVVSHEPPKNN